MYLAMNRFRIKKGCEQRFEDAWRQRESLLQDMPGFVEFNLLKGPEAEDHILYASHTIWEEKSHFEDWTRSDAFRTAHKNAGKNGDIYLGGPQFEGFESVPDLSVTKKP